MTVITERDKRFRRSSRPARPRRATVRWLRILWNLCLAGGCFVAGHQVVDALLLGSVLRVGDIVVEGNDKLAEGELLALLADLKGQRILEVDLEVYRQRLAASPWLVGGTLRRILPSTIEVLVEERIPVALARFSDLLYLVDKSGEVIAQYGPRFEEFDLPIIDGLMASKGSAAVVEPMRMALAMKLLDQLALHPEELRAISQVDVEDPYNAVVLLNDDPALLHLGGDRFVERLQFYAELASTLRSSISEIDYVDLRFEKRVYVRPMT